MADALAPALDALAAALRDRFGFALDDDDRRAELARVVAERALARGTPRSVYARAATGAAGGAELRAVAERLCVGESYFLRNRGDFELCLRVLVPERLRERPDRAVRIVSAGCASGQEPYSVVLLAMEIAPGLVDRLSVVGVDLSHEAIARARAARYGPWSLRGVDPAIVARWFHRRGQVFCVRDEVRSRVRFATTNLCEDDAELWAPGTIDVLFCRNVLMYFVPDAAARVVARFRRALAPGGALFLGHAETLRGTSADFELCNVDETFFYRPRGAPPLASARPPAQAAAPPPSVPSRPPRTSAATRTAGPGASRARSRSSAPSPPSPPSRAAPARAETPALDRVLSHLADERIDEALAMLAVDGDPAAPALQVIRATLLLNRGQVAEAEAAARRLLERDDLDPGAHYLIALCREHSGDVSGALEHDRKAGYLDPTFALPALHLGLLARRRGDAREARRSFERALELLAREDPARLLVFGGGLARETLGDLCRSELARLGGVG